MNLASSTRLLCLANRDDFITLSYKLQQVLSVTTFVHSYGERVQLDEREFQAFVIRVRVWSVFQEILQQNKRTVNTRERHRNSRTGTNYAKLCAGVNK